MRTIKTTDYSSSEIVKLALKVLKSGGIVIYPTETCYGIGVDSTNSEAVANLLIYKGDRKGKPISVAVDSIEMAKEYVEFNPQAENLFQNFLPGPITIVCDGKHKVDPKLESESGKLGLRYPNYKLALEIIKKFGKPITSTSANVSHGKTPYQISDILDNISKSKKELLDLIIDAGVLPYHSPSTIVDTTLNSSKILRQGEWKMPEGETTTYISRNVDETINYAYEYMKTRIHEDMNNKCLIFVLQGDLGAGKTQFAKGVAKALGITAKIKSPTFIFCSEYSFQLRTFFHIDTWRMESEKELYEIGFNEMLRLGNVILIEWGEKVFNVLKEIEKRKDVKIIRVKIETKEGNKRKIIVV